MKTPTPTRKLRKDRQLVTLEILRRRFQVFVDANKETGIDADKLAADLLKAGKEKIPEYAFDCHTLKGKRAGKTKADFFREEQKALKPWQPGLFDVLPGT